MPVKRMQMFHTNDSPSLHLHPSTPSPRDVHIKPRRPSPQNLHRAGASLVPTNFSASVRDSIVTSTNIRGKLLEMHTPYSKDQKSISPAMPQL
ncbi:hypothetical protein KC19_3G048600 [Ceratodon purpureus]|uniref:Uncharacterized protein n=1 Tax=Ceratodon purpureus TaxID=3225 RepID=A0A8T0IHJ7_CERPU|nr:hypothetical protein KC19_3G048600 [Ceratodon purpureus]